MTLPLMPKATAVWLIDNTTLTFDQIANFCGLHPLEVKGIADGEVAPGIVGMDPVANGQLNKAEIARCEADSEQQLSIIASPVPLPKNRTKGARYTPVSKRQDRPDAIAWLLKFHPEIADAQIQKLLGTTKATINSVRDRSHWNATNIKPRDPVSLGICTQMELDRLVLLAQKKKINREKRSADESRAAGRPVATPPAPAPMAPAAEIVVPPAPAEEELTAESVFGNFPKAQG